MKKRNLIALSAVTFVISFVFSGFDLAQAQEKKEAARVIEETLVVKDPTVSAVGKWVIGGAYEYWLVRGPYEVQDMSGNKLAEGKIDGAFHGGNIFVGYGNLTLNYALRKGSWDIDLKYTGNIDTTKDQDQEEQEVTLRYLVRALSFKYLTPYVLAGYAQINLDETETIKTPGWVWTYNWKTVKSYETTFKAPLVGIGLIFPFHERFGLRIDGRAYYSDAEQKWDNGKKYTGTGWGYGGTATAYVNIFKGLNLQVGSKYLKLDGGSDIGWWSKLGYFGMLGYSHKF